MKQTNHDFQNAQILLLEDICCTLDYLVSAACGAVAGLIDIFFVGAPGESALGAWSDAQVDGAVLKLSKLFGWKPGAGKENSIASAIGFLEKKFKVNYDQRHTADVGGLFDMSTRNHHIKSLAHAPDIIGLFFSVLNQFTNTASFVSQGTLITVQTDTFELVGVNPISKLFCGIANWFGHILSDIAGSSGSRGSSGRGAGIATPFYELLQFCDFGRLDIGKDKQDLATLAVRAFQEGYDARFGIAAALPVLLCDVSIRLIWSITRYFSLKLPLKKCLPVSAHQDLWVMLLFGNGTLCLIDGVDAAVRSGGNWLNFFMRLNLIAWVHFAGLVLKEVCIRAGIALEALDRLGEKELEILESFQHFSDLFEQIKNRPIFKGFQKEHVQIPTYDAEELKKVSIGAGVLLGGLGGAALGTAGGFAAAGATTAAVMALGTASTGTAIASLSGAAATNAALAALGGGAIAAGGGGIALGTAVLGGATAGVALLIGGVIFSLSGKKLSDKADEAWKQVEQEETEINKICSYLEKLHNAGTMLTVSLDAVNRKYQQHMKLLEDLVVTQGRTEWNTYTKAEKYLTENTVLLVNLLYQMCKVQLVQKIEAEDQINQVNEEAVKQTVNDATAVLRSL